MEQGITAGGGILIVHMIHNGENLPTLNKTWQEIHNASVCYIIEGNDIWSSRSFVNVTDSDDHEYYIVSREKEFIADSPNGTLTLISDNEPEK